VGVPTLFLAAGHGGSDKGNTAAGFIEAEETIKIVESIRKWYAFRRVPTGLGGCVFLNDSLDLVGQLGALGPWKLDAGDLAVDIHLDYKAGARGAMVIVDETTLAQRFGQVFLAEWCRATGIPTAGVGIFDSKLAAKQWRSWSDYGWCAPRWPGVIVELGRMNAGDDMAIVRNPVYQVMAGEIIWHAWQQAKDKLAWEQRLTRLQPQQDAA
jgi:hypothetical protein